MKKTIKKLALFLSVAIVISSCDTVDFGDINNNPNNATTAIPSQLLAQAQKYIGGNLDANIEGTIVSRAGILYTQQITQGQYPSFSKYSNTEFSYNSWYTGPIQNLNEIIKVNEDAETSSAAGAFGDNNNQIAVAKLLRAYFLNYMTDTWGALPWSEAFQGIDLTTPKFDSQQSLYNYMFDEIDDALGRINAGAGPAGDVMFNGNMSKWKTFGNTLKLIMALRISDVDPALAKTKFEAAANSGSMITSVAGNLVFNYASTEESDNPWEDRFESREDYIMSETFINFLTANTDPRMQKYSSPSTNGGVYVGAENGKVNGNVPDYSFITGTVIYDKQYSNPIYTLAQVKFSLAEAKMKGWNVGAGTTASLFKDAIEASMMQWGVDVADMNAYTAAHTTVNMTTIAYEKWVSLYLNGPESWAEWRRLDAPVLTPSIYASDQRIPVRHAYSGSIGDNNPDNYAAVIAAQGPDTNHTKLWWDVN